MSKCRICNGDAISYLPTGDFEHLDCAAGCGEYKISGTAIQMVKNKIKDGQRVDVSATRKWLDKQRLGTTDVPKIESINLLYE